MTTQKNGAALATNGKASPAEEKATATLAVIKTEKKEEPTAPEKKQPEALPLEDRILKLNRLFEIQTKYNRLDNSLNLLKEFDLKKDGECIEL